MEPHDIVISCTKLLMSEEAAYDGIMPPNEMKGSLNYRTILGLFSDFFLKFYEIEILPRRIKELKLILPNLIELGRYVKNYIDIFSESSKLCCIF